MSTQAAPPWVPAAISWGRDMATLCMGPAVTVQEYVDGELNVDLDTAHRAMLEGTQIALNAVNVWRSAGAAPLDVANAIAQLNQQVTGYMKPEAERGDYTNPESFARSAAAWNIATLAICNRLEDIEALIRAHMQAYLLGAGDAFGRGVMKSKVTSLLKKAGLVLITVIGFAGLWGLSRRLDK